MLPCKGKEVMNMTPDNNNKQQQRKPIMYYYAVVMVILMTSALIINLYILQIVNHESFVSRSNSNRIKIIPIAPPRGLIYDPQVRCR